MSKTGFIRTAAVSPELRVANTTFNTEKIIDLAKEASEGGAGIILFPELAITAYTCGDLFYQEHLYQKNLEGLKKIIDASNKIDAVLIVGFYYRTENNFYNCAAVIQHGKLMGIVPKMFVPNNREFYEGRWFSSALRLSNDTSFVSIFGEDVPFGHLIFCDEENGISIGVEICHDLWMPISPGSRLCLNGAHIIFNPSASNDTVGKAYYRRQLVRRQSNGSICGYVYASAGVHESTTDLVFSGHCLIAEYGTIIGENQRFERDSCITYGEIDYERIKFERATDHGFESCTSAYTDRSQTTFVVMEPFKLVHNDEKLIRKIEKNPFIPSDEASQKSRCEDIFKIQSAGLAKRLEHTKAKTVILGISGGLDSTLALLVCAETMKLLGRSPKDIITVTMPGFGTSNRTKTNADIIMECLGTDAREIPIGEAVLQHFQDIGHDPAVHDTTYENSQARERTQILMDIAGKEGGFVVGTGDLSELALGWCTYNGDHMAMYGVNASIPKTLVQMVVKWFANNKLSGPEEDVNYSSDNAALRAALLDIVDTPISPELLPTDTDGNIAQKTEERVGPYILHDFFLYYTLRFSMQPRKLLYLATQTFEGQYEPDYIKKWLREFYRRFFSQQFKRNCLPDGPKVGTVTLSPRGDWRMPSDADVSIWLEELDD